MSILEKKVRAFGCFDQVAKVIGEEKAVVELIKVVEFELSKFSDDMQEDKLINAFDWEDTPQLFDFWYDIYRGKNPYTESAGENKGEGVL